MTHIYGTIKIYKKGFGFKLLNFNQISIVHHSIIIQKGKGDCSHSHS